VRIARVEATMDRTPDRLLAGRLRRVYEGVPRPMEGDNPGSSTLRLAIHELRALCRSLEDLKSRRLADFCRSQERAARVTGWGLLAVGTLGSGVGIVLGLGVARGIARSVGMMCARAKTVAQKLDGPEEVLADGSALDRLGLQLRIVSRGVDHVTDRLRSRELELEHAERLANLGRLAAGVAHELRNPLFAVKALVQVNREEAEARGLPADDLRVIEAELRGMERQVRSLIGLARPTRGGARVADLADTARHVVALFRGRSRTQRVDITAEIPERGMHVQGDPEQIQQVAVNLLQNALDATPEGGKVDVEVRRTAFDQVEFIVRDNGPGIDAHVLPAIFEPFVSTKPNGLGIGLAVARRIADSLGGSLSATNLPRRGACFTLRLPPPPAQRRAGASKDQAAVLEATG
jgi:signal transduction histidine kinase